MLRVRSLAFLVLLAASTAADLGAFAAGRVVGLPLLLELQQA